MSDGNTSLSPLVIRLFGSCDVQLEGRPLPRLRTRKVLWLLALLALRHDREIDRVWLAGALWPDSLETQALANLRLALSDLRGALGLQATRIQTPTNRIIRFDSAESEIDIVLFDRNIHAEDEVALKAIELYRGALLEGCLEEWAISERAIRQQAYLKALNRFAEDSRKKRNLESEIAYRRQILAIDSFNETSLCALLEALAVKGDIPSLKVAYRDFRGRIVQHLNADLHPNTVSLYNQLLEKTQETNQSRVPVKPTQPSTSSNLPNPISKLIGREKETNQVYAALGASRLVTLKGSGGIGKTRLAIAVGDRLGKADAEDIWFVDLSAHSSPEAVIQTVASVLMVRENANQRLLNALTLKLQRRPALLILDNCEHLLAACTELADSLLRRCPNLRILATSRQALGLIGEQVYRVPSLSQPNLKLTHTQKTLSDFESVQLFCARAKLAQPDFALSDENATTIAQLCVRLDGIPLPIELAAARVRNLSLEEVNRRLAQRFSLLTGGNRTALPRQETLHSLIKWSYDLLTDSEKRLLCNLSVFSGGCSFEAAHAISFPSEIEETEALDLLDSLCDKSLLVNEDRNGVTRYRLLETVREFASQQLVSEERNSLCRRHADYFISHIPTSRERHGSDSNFPFFQAIENELDNILAAFDWSWLLGDRVMAAGSLCILNGFWYTRGFSGEGHRQLSAALNHTEAFVPKIFGTLMSGAGTLAFAQGDYETSENFHGQSLAHYRRADLEADAGYALNDLAAIASVRQEHQKAEALFLESLSLFRRLGLQDGVAYTLIQLGRNKSEEADFTNALSILEEAREIASSCKLTDYLAFALESLGYCLNGLHRYVDAKTTLKEALEMRRKQGHRPGIATTLANLGLSHLYLKEMAEAKECWQEAQGIWKEQGNDTLILMFEHQFGAIN